MAQTRHVSKRQVEVQLAKLAILKTPSLKLEQYPVSAEVASELLYMAGFERHDLDGRTLDLGTGTGRLAIGAALLGSNRVTGVDVDPRALGIARENALTAGVDVDWIQSPIDEFEGSYDTVIMNPPYGTRSSHADLRFLDKAFQLALVVYSIHKSATRDFLTKYVQKKDRRIEETRSMLLDIPNLFNFHKKKSKSVEVDLYRIV